MNQNEQKVYPDHVRGQIYVITHKESYKQYVGQTRSHYANRSYWLEAGYIKRWHAHIDEAIKNRAKQSTKLNNAIRKYGIEAFDVELLLTCHPDESDFWEERFIEKLGTYLKGYNLTTGGKKYSPSENMKEQISKTLVVKSDMDRSGPLKDKVINRVYISRKIYDGRDIVSALFHTDKGPIKIDFGGKMQPIEDSLKRAIKFILSITHNDRIVVQDRIKDIVDQLRIPIIAEINAILIEPIVALIPEPIIELPKIEPVNKLADYKAPKQKDVNARYEKLKHLNIDTIRIGKRKHGKGEIAELTINHDQKKKFSLFGGSTVPIEKSLTDAITLALRLVDKSKIKMQKGLTHNLI